jgi:pyruvate, water dikinase
MHITNLFKHWTYQIFSPTTVLRQKYEAFKSLLTHDKQIHELMAELEEIYHNQVRVDFTVIEDKYNDLSRYVFAMLEDFSKMCPSCYPDLKDYFKRFDSYVRFIFVSKEHNTSDPFTIPLNEIPSDGYALVGGKALNLSIVERDLHLPIPKGVVITTNAFCYFTKFNDLRKSIDKKLTRLDINSTASLNIISHELVDIMMKAQIPPDMEEDILNAYTSLQKSAGKNVRLALRSSAIGEDTRSSFAGQYRTILNVRKDGMLDAYKAVIASKYSPRALYYRISYGLLDTETPMAVLALEMIDSAVSGIVYTENIEDFDSKSLTVHSIWGLGELLVGGEVSPDIINVKKKERPEIIRKQTGIKSRKMVLSPRNSTEIVSVDDGKQRLHSIDDASALILADWGMRLEKHFKEPQDIEWCMDNNDRLFLLQSRPLRSKKTDLKPLDCKFEGLENPVLVSGGETACSGIGAGKVFRINRESDLENLHEGAVLVARNASPNYVTVMNKLSAVVTDTGSTAGHFSSVAREFGVPTLVNARFATARLTHGNDVTVYADGREVYDGIVQIMLESPCARRNLLSDSPFVRKLRYVINFISPLRLTDPQAESFVPEEVRSLHDILRFTHEKAVQEMFHMGDRRIRKTGSARKLISHIPMLFYIIDVGGGLRQDTKDKKTVKMDDVLSVPMTAVFKGLSHPEIKWSQFTHFDWAEYDRIVMSGGIISPEAAMFASYAVMSYDYLNLNLRFGYHFVILDTICGDKTEDNYILFRFSGGGADFDKRSLRADFLSGVLQRLGFDVDKKSDLIEGQLKIEDKKTTEHKLDVIGRLLGATRLMDMYLKDDAMVESYVEEFINGRYHFATDEGTA